MNQNFEYRVNTYETRVIDLKGNPFYVTAEANLPVIQANLERNLRSQIINEYGDPSSVEFRWYVSEPHEGTGARLVTCGVTAIVHRSTYGASDSYGRTSGIQIDN